MLARFLLFSPPRPKKLPLVKLEAISKIAHTFLSRFKNEGFITEREAQRLAREILLRVELSKFPDTNKLQNATRLLLDKKISFQDVQTLARESDIGIDLYYFIEIGAITLKEALALKREDRFKLLLLHSFLMNGAITWSQVKQLPQYQIDKLYRLADKSSPLAELIGSKKIPLETVLNLSLQEALELDRLSFDIKRDGLKVADALIEAKKSLTESKAAKNIKKILDDFKILIRSNHMDESKILEYNQEQRDKIWSGTLLIERNKMSINEVLQYSKTVIETLSQFEILISHFSPVEVLNLSEEDKTFLHNNYSALVLVGSGIVSVDEVKNYKEYQLYSMRDCIPLIQEGILSREEASNMPPGQSSMFTNLMPFLITKMLTPQEASQCTWNEALILFNTAGDFVFRRIKERKVQTIDESVPRFNKAVENIIVEYIAPPASAFR